MTLKRFLILTVGTLAATLLSLAFGAPAALAADSLNVALSNSNPVRGIPITVTFSGTTTPYDANGDTPYLYALVRPVNGVPCQSTFGTDMQVSSTTNIIRIFDGDTASSGNFSYSATITPTAGSYIVCAWLETDSNDYNGRGDTPDVVTATATTGYTTKNSDTLGISLPTASPSQGVPITVTFSGTATPYDANGNTPNLYALVRQANGVQCQPTFGADMQVSGNTSVTEIFNADNNGNTVSSGNYSYSATITPTVGSYIVCAWLETDSNDYSGRGDTSSVVTATANAQYSVVPPVECVVPQFAGSTLAGIEQRLADAHCGIGPVHWIRWRHTRRGQVIGLSVSPGSERPAGYQVGITVSRGR